ncbi:hypothetical protein BGZ80_002534 [Entomortierella chlamydospora]|uniref:Cytochrome P450 n=1 Tax=Entomortierella chlamydospora TaxID=101097 RepID=A0A9P6N2P9_9FUNG|nr:hypothetical protein BGZ79_006905 [Entomortierella chlamydospora]KAG0021369.1 hypothetical protein BGZ80_002534 [Entomortierella chlamydospora]
MTSSAVLRLLTRGNASKLFLAYVLYIVFKYRRSVYGIRPRPEIKGPRGLPLIGNTLEMIAVPQTRILEEHERLRALYGRVYTYAMPKVGRIIYLHDPEIIDHVLRTNFWAYGKGQRAKEVAMPLTGNGIFTADGDHWKWQRKLASNIFSVKAFRQYTSDVFCREGDLAIEYLNKIADTGKPVDIQQLFYCYTLDSFGEIAFGVSFGSMKDPEQEVDFAAAFDRLTHGVAGRVYSPIWWLTDWWTGNGKQVEKDSKLVRDFALRVIQERRNKEHAPAQEKDLLQLFMDLTDDDGQPLSDDMLIDSVLNFIIAGRDTTAQSLAWMFYLMHRNGSNPEFVQGLIKETDEILKGGYPTYESTKQQKYAEACFHETSRLYPSVPRSTRICFEDDVLPGGIKIYKGERIGWSTWVMGRDTTIWGPDAKEFNPNRWLNNDKPSSSKFLSFHHGPRTCLGQQYATIEAITITSMLFQKFTFELVDPNVKPTYYPSPTLPIAGGLSVLVKRRTDIAV